MDAIRTLALGAELPQTEVDGLVAAPLFGFMTEWPIVHRTRTSIGNISALP